MEMFSNPFKTKLFNNSQPNTPFTHFSHLFHKCSNIHEYKWHKQFQNIGRIVNSKNGT